jgi:hypothetical protein
MSSRAIKIQMTRMPLRSSKNLKRQDRIRERKLSRRRKKLFLRLRMKIPRRLVRKRVWKSLSSINSPKTKNGGKNSKKSSRRRSLLSLLYRRVLRMRKRQRMTNK